METARRRIAIRLVVAAVIGVVVALIIRKLFEETADLSTVQPPLPASGGTDREEPEEIIRRPPEPLRDLDRESDPSSDEDLKDSE